MGPSTQSLTRISRNDFPEEVAPSKAIENAQHHPSFNRLDSFRRLCAVKIRAYHAIFFSLTPLRYPKPVRDLVSSSTRCVCLNDRPTDIHRIANLNASPLDTSAVYLVESSKRLNELRAFPFLFITGMK